MRPNDGNAGPAARAGSRRLDRGEAPQRTHPTWGVNFNQSGTSSGSCIPADTYAKTARTTTNLMTFTTSTPRKHKKDLPRSNRRL
jgi:hypothetical protein